MKKIVISEDAKFDNMSIGDPFGRVFEYNGEILRGIYSDSEEACMDLFETGLIDALVRKKYIPKTTITDYIWPEQDFNLIIKTERIPNISYRYEWTLSMQVQAARLVLNILEEIAKYDYSLKDCHQYNILFSCGEPIYVDIGSFIKKSSRAQWVLLEGQFKACYLDYFKYCKRYSEAIVKSNLIQQSSRPFGELNNSKFNVIQNKCRWKFAFLVRKCLGDKAYDRMLREMSDRKLKLIDNDIKSRRIKKNNVASSENTRTKKIKELLRSLNINNIIIISDQIETFFLGGVDCRYVYISKDENVLEECLANAKKYNIPLDVYCVDLFHPVGIMTTKKPMDRILQGESGVLVFINLEKFMSYYSLYKLQIIQEWALGKDGVCISIKFCNSQKEEGINQFMSFYNSKFNKKSVLDLGNGEYIVYGHATLKDS